MSNALDPPRVLVADDQPDILDALHLVLKGAGFETDLVQSTHDVRARLRAGAYDLLLMDLNYARDTTSAQEGLELLDDVRRCDRTMPIIAMTGWASIETAVEAMRHGASSFVQKPWDNSALVRLVRREVEDGCAARDAQRRAAMEMDDARAIQRALLPSSLPVVAGGQFAALSVPAAGIGGDSYDAIEVGPSAVALSVADVIGKGLPAALLMANLQASVRASASRDSTPALVAARVNRLLCDTIASGKFVTMCYAVLDTDRWTLAYTNAGHNPAILVHADGSIDRLAVGGPFLGVFPEAAFAQGEVPLKPGDRLVLFTDGLTEARNARNEEFGDRRLEETVQRHRGANAPDLMGIVYQDVLRFAGSTLQDDATMVVVGRP